MLPMANAQRHIVRTGMTEGSLLRGVMPVAPTVFDDDEGLDLDGQRRVVDYLVAAEVDAICILANYSEQFSLDDGERVAVIEASIGRAAGRVPIAVTTSHFSARVAAARTRDAQERGARMAMLMAPFFGTSVRASEEGVVEYFKRVAGDLEIDLMIQDAPMSATPLPVSLLARIAREVPQVRYVKVEVPQAAAKLRALKAMAGESLPGLFDGEEGVTLIHDLDAGAIGTMPSCSGNGNGFCRSSISRTVTWGCRRRRSSSRTRASSPATGSGRLCQSSRTQSATSSATWSGGYGRLRSSCASRSMPARV